MELCYTNNPNSLFRKYALLLTSLTKHQLFRDYLQDAFEIPQERLALLLPNGYVRKDGDRFQMVVTTRACYAPKLYPALAALDSVHTWISDFSETQRLLAWQLGLRSENPAIAKRIHLSEIIVNPNASPETTSTDGYAARQNATGESWAAQQGGTGTTSSHTTTNARIASIVSYSTTNNFQECFRGFFLFDTSALGTGATILNTTKFSVYATGTNDNFAGSPHQISVVNTTPASNTAIANADYQSGSGSTLQATTINIPGTGAYTDITLNSTGDASISLTGITKFGTRIENDRANSAPTWGSLETISVNANYADNGSNEPKLTVDYSIPAGGFLLSIL